MTQTTFFEFFEGIAIKTVMLCMQHRGIAPAGRNCHRQKKKPLSKAHIVYCLQCSFRGKGSLINYVTRGAAFDQILPLSPRPSFPTPFATSNLIFCIHQVTQVMLHRHRLSMTSRSIRDRFTPLSDVFFSPIYTRPTALTLQFFETRRGQGKQFL